MRFTKKTVLAIASFVLLLLQALGVRIDFPVVNEVICAGAGVLVMLGLISDSPSSSGSADNSSGNGDQTPPDAAEEEPAPEETDTAAPEETDAPTPGETDTTVPEETDAPTPEETDTTVPEETTGVSAPENMGGEVSDPVVTEGTEGTEGGAADGDNTADATKKA